MHTEIRPAEVPPPQLQSASYLAPVPDPEPLGSVAPMVSDRPPSQLSRIRHDIQHELATIMLLADVVVQSSDVGTVSKNRILQLGREANWLNQLLGAYDEATKQGSPEEWTPPAASVRVDILVGEVLAALSLTSSSRVRFTSVPAWTWANRLAMWRALRNLLDNAFRAVGEVGQIDVSVNLGPDGVVVEIDDNGPGFGLGPKGFASLGLGIVQDFAVERGGRVEIAPGHLGGSCVRLLLPAVSVLSDWADDPEQNVS
jgi:signal transduction histidine kinase